MRLYKAGEAARLLQVPPSTLRVYCKELKDAVSAWARGERGSAVSGRGGPRRYTDADLALLTRARELLAAGRTYGQVRAILAGEEAPEVKAAEPWSREKGGAEAPEVGVARVGGAEGSEWGELVRMLIRVAETAQRGAETWRELVQERNREIALLAERVAELERRGGGKWFRWGR